MQRKAHPQDGHPNATRKTQQGTSASWAPQRNARHVRKLGNENVPQCMVRNGKCVRHVRKMGAQTQHKARPQVGMSAPQRWATQGTSARWSPKRKTHPQRKRPHKGALGLKTSWRMDKNIFWLGGRLFNTASPRLGTPTQRNACPQDGHPNATQGTSASWVPQCNARHVRKLGAPMHVRNANARHFRNARHVCTFASWVPQRNTRHVRKMVAQTQNSSETKTSTQGSTRLKDELEDG
jgi:hypothetical protein